MEDDKRSVTEGGFMKKTLFTLLGSSALIISTLFSTATMACPINNKAAYFNSRVRNQEVRIAQGIRFVQITPNEAVRLQQEEANIKREIIEAERYGRINEFVSVKIQRDLDKTAQDIYFA